FPTRRSSDLFLEKPTIYWQEKCNENNIPCGPIQTLDEVAEDPQLHAREMFIDYDHPTAGPIKMIGSPLKLSRTPVTVKRHPPNVEEHNDVILNKIKQNKLNKS